MTDFLRWSLAVVGAATAACFSDPGEVSDDGTTGGTSGSDGTTTRAPTVGTTVGTTAGPVTSAETTVSSSVATTMGMDDTTGVEDTTSSITDTGTGGEVELFCQTLDPPPEACISFDGFDVGTWIEDPTMTALPGAIVSDPGGAISPPAYISYDLTAGELDLLPLRATTSTTVDLSGVASFRLDLEVRFDTAFATNCNEDAKGAFQVLQLGLPGGGAPEVVSVHAAPDLLRLYGPDASAPLVSAPFASEIDWFHIAIEAAPSGSNPVTDFKLIGPHGESTATGVAWDFTAANDLAVSFGPVAESTAVFSNCILDIDSVSLRVEG